ncbi:TetR/AcrR family transcriptional regulator [Actinoplanes sp. NBC_00393]|uniref:TetR/AcrR family transcriptional regulator n=1 Tax=Actinoplanes sp. NBC_00393 TaxID=2975953 RepID=UPI002E1D1EFF
MPRPTTSVSRIEQKRRTRVALVQAARGLLVTQGYATTTAEMIAKEAGVSRATFYLHFRSKAEIVVELMRNVEPDIVADFQRLGTIDPTPAAAESWLRGHAQLWRRYRMEFTSMEQALANEQAVADEWFSFYRRLADGIPGVIDRLVTGGLSRERAEARLVALVMTIDRAFHFTVVRDRPDFFDAVVAEIAEALASALSGSPSIASRETNFR